VPLALAAQSVPTTAFRRIYRFTDPRQFGVDFFDRRIRARHEVRFAPRHDCSQSLNLMVLAITYSTFDARAVVGYPTPLCIIVAAFMREQKPERLSISHWKMATMRQKLASRLRYRLAIIPAKIGKP